MSILDIAALSIGMNQATLKQNVSIALTKKVMESTEQNSAELIKMLETSHPTLGKSIDLKA
ncbi:YjfB family protein [Cytobacillus praedii]|uniref:YjfB family protein n=1 Tax=Cytobacillus praedii TaxID=1742358 RepID=UPI003AF94DA8